MAGIPLFSEAPNQISNQTLGWTSKTIYSYQNYLGLTVAHTENAFEVITANGLGEKGDYIFIPEYFMKPNTNQGRVIKITMHFYLDFAETTVEIRTGLIDTSVPQDYLITPQNSVTIASGGGNCYCKYECYLNVYENSGPQRWLQAIGDIRIQKNLAGDLASSAISNEIELTPGLAVEYALVVSNRCLAPIKVTNLIVEEIG